MIVSPVPRIAGALLFTPAPQVDERGFFGRTFDAQVAQSAGPDPAASSRTACPGRPGAWSGACTCGELRAP
jgi:dTDP-4-dehydrorhamnose 3,5-epimerase-like enzyme